MRDMKTSQYFFQKEIFQNIVARGLVNSIISDLLSAAIFRTWAVQEEEITL